jgi:16S rRNA (uracil1498-N3)-methyltransferase
MTRRRWIADEVSGNRAALVGSHADHLARVLRGRIGQEFDISTGENVRRGRITNIAEGRIEFDLGEIIPTSATPTLTLLLSIFKFDRMEWAIEKCSELGAARIVPVIAQRTEVHLAAAAPKRVERWQRLALQASEQARRAQPPEISPPARLKDAMTASGGVRIVLAESEHGLMLKDAIVKDMIVKDAIPRAALQSPVPASEITLAFGPEGGWTQTEFNLFLQAGWIAASLGSTILRAETAAIAATAVALAAMS